MVIKRRLASELLTKEITQTERMINYILIVLGALVAIVCFFLVVKKCCLANKVNADLAHDQ